MATCPNCNILLQTVRAAQGIYYHCSQCDGRALTAAQVRRTTGDRFVTALLRQIRHATEESARACPSCQVPMKTIQRPQPPTPLDTCKSCTTVWFDTGQFEQLPEGIVDTPESAMERAIEAEAKWKMEERERLHRGMADDAPDEPWKWVLAMLGLPIKYESPELSRRPWATWSLALLMIFVTFWAFPNLKEVVDQFGLIPNEKWRYGGFTFLSSFFLHAGFFHLAGNLYFFLLFSGEVEQYLGRWRLVTLVLLSAFVGDWFHIWWEPRSDEPSIGASGGISGVLVFYALQFPKARILFFIVRLGWLHLPAWGAFLIWFLIQLFGISMQRAGLSNVSALAHVGGVATGIVLWFLWRKLKPHEPVESIEPS